MTGPTKLQVALANAASRLLQMHEAQIAKTDDLRICDDMDALLRLRAFAIELAKVCDPLFNAVAETAHIVPEPGYYASVVSDALDGNLAYKLLEKAEEIFEARSHVQFDDFRDLRTHPGSL